MWWIVELLLDAFWREQASHLHLAATVAGLTAPPPWPCRRHKYHGRSAMALIISDEQQVTLRAAPLTKSGKPARVDGIPAWSSSDPEVASVAAAPDGLSAVIVPGGKAGTAQVLVSADADLGPGTRTISASFDVEVVVAEAAIISVTADAPVDRA